ncbi:MAG: tRNA (adenosine(37)-N6)-threonylcarbamoyltransferase complex dimerization subunit type 1 TsaB [Bacteroidetes bacterium]|nr:tRNA (adenosine(37)-N6)-threonylcarbamoyltransferase complex dimerization subunit type 1 TsaB [Bacteroidota bacterium]
MILCIETSGEICSVALADNIYSVFYLENKEANAHSKVLLPMIDKILTENNISRTELKAIALSSGPGSYTGLRIGSAAAKSICMALTIPLIAIDTLEILAFKMKNNAHNADFLIPLLDARRMEVYTAVFDSNAKRISEDQPHILSFQTPDLWNHKNVVLAGSGANKTFHFLKEIGVNTEIIENCYPDAQSMVHIAFDRFEQKKFDNLINFEPAYLKPFYTNAKPIQHNS